MNDNEKKQLRRELILRRKNIADRDEKDRLIFERIMCCDCVKNSDAVLIYASYNGEVDTFRIIRRLLEIGKPVFTPKCRENSEMIFLRIESENDLAEGAYGILEPVGDIQPVITEKTVCIVPAVSFTAKGERLGYGGGYYDRFLSKYPKLCSVGICYEELISDSLPCAEHDINVNYVITEERTVCSIVKG